MSKQQKANAGESSFTSLQKKFNSRIDEARGFAKQTVLAGLGAMDRSVEEVNTLRNTVDEQIADLSKKGSELFDELVERGGKVQADAQDNREAFEKEVNVRIDKLKVKVAELTEELGVADSLESLAGTLDSLSKRFNKKA